MEEFIHLSRAVAADLAAEFRDDPSGELAAWLRVAIEREGMIARLYRRRTVENRFASLPGNLAPSAITKLNGIGAREEEHVTVIRSLLAAEARWPYVALKESWGRLQAIVLNQLAGANSLARSMALATINLGARSPRERSAAKLVAGLDARGFLKLSRTLEITAVESYQRVMALLAVLSGPERESRYNPALDFKILEILRDERVHRDVFHVLHRALGNGAALPPHSPDWDTTELPDNIATLPISGAAGLNQVCRAILAFHYGAALPSGASADETTQAAADYWRWQVENPLRKSYLVECQRQDACRPEGDVLLLGTAGLEDVVQAVPSMRCRTLDRRTIARAARG